MKAKKRYLLVLASVAFLALCYFGGHRLKDDGRLKWRDKLPETAILRSGPTKPPSEVLLDRLQCRMETCFDLSKCRGRPFKVYVYPEDEQARPSETYGKILNRIRESNYYTSDPDEACLFVLSLDTLDRDPLSSADYVRNMPARISKLPYNIWNGGTNHIIFNLYSGTYPGYDEDALGFDPGRAMLAKASMSDGHYRTGFDVSIPLFAKDHPERGGDSGAARILSNTFPVAKRYFLAFKGKRYVYGIGSETRNSLYHLHNGRDMVLVTTCKHGKSWKELKDERCDEDNQEFDRWDYDELLTNATFCLVPRGRRLGSFRFIETLRAGCVPVMLSNGWRLPFAEVIDWPEAVLQADERLLLQVPEILHSVSPAKVFAMRQQTQILWDRYLSSVDKIVDTTIEIIRGRINAHASREGLIWNSDPGALLTLNPGYSDSYQDFPFDFGECSQDSAVAGCDLAKKPSGQLLDTSPPSPWSSLSTFSSHQPLLSANDNRRTNNNSMSFTAVIYTQLATTSVVHLSAPIFKLARNVAASAFVDKIIVIWTSESRPPPTTQWPFIGGRTRVPVHVLHVAKAPVSERFRPNDLIKTDAILSLDDDAAITTEEMDFAFSVWQHFPDRIVGFPARSFYWDDRKHAWAYTSKWSNEYAMVLTGAAFYHRYYNHMYTEWLPPIVHKTVDQASNCEDILMNFLVSHITRRPPIKVTQRKQYKEPSVKSPWSDPSHFAQRQSCINTFTAVFGYMPLQKSSTRFDPVLYKDAVANARKKYRKLELIPITSGVTSHH